MDEQLPPVDAPEMPRDDPIVAGPAGATTEPPALSDDPELNRNVFTAAKRIVAGGLGTALSDILASGAGEPSSAAIVLQAANNINKDPLTKLARQAEWFAALSGVIERRKPGDSLRVYVADLDGFKAVNDQLGHMAGDELLGIVAQAFRESFQRSSDVLTRGSKPGNNDDSIARFGGDEFGVFTRTSAEQLSEGVRRDDDETAVLQAQRVNSRLRELLTGTKFDTPNIKLKLSIGSAALQEGESANDVFARADYAMFKEKYSGKIDNLAPEDRDQLLRIIPYLEGLGVRVESWVKIAVGLQADKD